MKKCIMCNETLDLTRFHKDKSRKDGLSPRCKSCKSHIDAKYRQSNKETICDNQQKYYENNSEKIKKRANTWYHANKEQHAARMKQYFQENKALIKEKHQQYNDKHKVKMQEYMNTYIKNKYHTDTNYKVKSILSARIRSLVRKDTATLEFIGCPMETFREWIEFQFTDEMTWDNCGKYWHFDHVKPCSSYDLSDPKQVLECFNWNNIRPLEAKRNMSKGGKVCLDTLAMHNKVVEQFTSRRTKALTKVDAGGE